MGIFLRRSLNGLPLLGSYPEGTLAKINEDGSPVEFYIAKHDYESELNGVGRTLLVRKDCYDTRIFNKSVNEYADGDLDAWLNGTYVQLLDADIQAAISTTKFYYSTRSNDYTVTTLQRAVFQLSLTELGKTASYANTEGTVLPIASTLQIANLDGDTVTQWTRTPRTTNYLYACYLSNKGVTSNSDCRTTSRGSRPAFTLPSNTLVGDDMLIA